MASLWKKEEEGTMAFDFKKAYKEQGYALDFGPDRWHHELYLSDPRRGRPEKRKTVLRLPVRKEGP